MKITKVSEKNTVIPVKNGTKVTNGVKVNSAPATAQANKTDTPLSSDLLQKMNAYWRAANYLSVGQIYLYDNPLLKEPLKLAHVKPLVVGIGARRPARTSSR